MSRSLILIRFLFSSSVLISLLASFDLTAQYSSTTPIAWFTPESQVDLENDKVVSWHSHVNDLVFTQPVEENRTVLETEVALNGATVMSFNGEAYMDLPITLTESLDLFMVVRGEIGAQSFLYDTPSRLFQFFNADGTAKSGSLAQHNSLMTQGYYYITNVKLSSQQAVLFENGKQKAAGAENRNMNGNFRIGASINTDRFFTGRIAEIILYGEQLSSEETEIILDSLRNKYTQKPDLGADRLHLPGCALELAVADRFKSYRWFKAGNTTPILPDTTSNSLSVNDPGTYVLKCLTMFDEFQLDTVVVNPFDTSVFSNALICESQGTYIDIDLPSAEFTIDWQHPDLVGFQIEITEPGTYSAQITRIVDGCIYYGPLFVVQDIEVATEINVPEVLCEGNEIGVNTSGFPDVFYFWSTGSTAPFITPQESGTYWVEVSNQNNCVGRDTVEVDIVGEAPEVAFTTGPVCIDNPVTFQDATEPEAGTTPVAWTWYLGNDTLHTESAQATYHQTGPVPVALTLTLDNGCTGTARDTLLVNPLPEVNFSAPIVCAGNEAFFESFATVPDGEILDLLWNFGNNTTDQGVIGSTVFQNLGDNTVTLTATSTAGCVDSLSRTVEVLGSPVADFEFQNVCIGQTMAFNELVDTQESGPVFYRWSFGDGFFSNFPNTGHQYAAPGAYEVTLTATGNNLGANGCKDTITKTVIVFPPPTAQAAANDTCFGTPLTLADLTPPKVVADTPDPVVDRLWTLTESPSGGGGVLGEDSLLTWIPDLPGAHAVRLDVVTAAGCHAHKVTNLSILPAPHADFALELPVQAPPITAQPQNTSQGATHHQWFLNGDPVATAPDPEITFPDTGQYTLTLVAANELLCADTVSKHFRVIIPRYDIVLGELYPQVQNGRLRIQAALYNSGNTSIHAFDARARVGNGPEIAFAQNATIPPGNTVLHDFTTSFQWRSADLPYVCLWVGNPNGIDLDPDAPAEADITNNYRCAALPVSEPIISDPRPNPATHEVHLSVVLPRAATAALDLIDPSGRTIRSSRQPLPEGYSPFTMDVSNLQPGMYLLRLEIGEEVIVRRIVVK